MMDPAAREDPFPYYDELRAQGRIVSSGLALITAHHDVCLAVLRSPDFGQLRLDRLPWPLQLAMKIGGRPFPGPIEPPSRLATNPPEHTRYRKLITRAFAARAVTALRSRVEDIAEELFDEIARSMPNTGPDSGGPTVDLVTRYASLLPATVITEMLGAPVTMRRQFLAWGAGADDARGWLTVGEDRFPLPCQGNATDSGGQRFPAGAFDDRLQARAWPVRCVDGGLVVGRGLRHRRAVLAGECPEQCGVHDSAHPGSASRRHRPAGSS